MCHSRIKSGHSKNIRRRKRCRRNKSTSTKVSGAEMRTILLLGHEERMTKHRGYLVLAFDWSRTSPKVARGSCLTR